MLQLEYKQTAGRFSPQYCSDLSMFGALKPETTEFLLQQGRIIQLEPGEHLFRTGEPACQFYIILSGAIGYYHNDGEQLNHIRNFNLGEQIGFVSMIGLHPRRGDCIAEESSCLLEISAELFQKISEERTEEFAIFLINMTREMSREISDLDNICSQLKKEKTG